MSSRKRRSSPSLQDSSASQSTFPSPARTEKRKLHSPAQQQSISYSQLSKDTASCQVEATSDRQKQDSSVKSSLVPSSSGKKKRNSKASSLRTPTKTSDVAIMPATGKATPLTSSKEKRVDSVAAQDTPGNKVKKPETKASMVLDPSCPAAKSTPTVDPSIKSQKRSKQVTETESVSQPNNMPAVKPEQITLGIRTLIEHSNKTIRKKTDEGHMFADDVGSNEQFVSLVLSMKKIPNKEKHKPVKIELPHPLIDPKLSAVCLIVKDPQREYKDLLAEHNIKFVSKVVGIAKLKGKHSSFEARRQLLNSHALFLADARVIPMLPNILGSVFFRSKKLPIPIDLTNPKRIKGELEQAVSSTYLRLGTGSCVSIKIADLSRHDENQIQENLHRVIQQLNKKIPSGGWANIQGLHIKTGTSVSLPIWLAGLDSNEFGRFAMQSSQAEVDAKRGAQEKKRQALEEKAQKKKRRLTSAMAAPASE